MLRILTHLAPVMHSKTRWSGKYFMFEKFSKIYDSLRTVDEHGKARVAMNLTYEFKSTVKRFEKQLFDINEVTKYLLVNYQELTVINELKFRA